MKTILIIEDEQNILDNTVDVLTLENFETLTASDGLAGLELALKHHPQMIICDIRLPRMDGYQVLENLQKNAETADIPFVFMSAHANPDDIKRAREMGMDYLVKPFRINELLEIISKYMKQ